MAEKALTPVLSLEDRYSQMVIEDYHELCLRLPPRDNPTQTDVSNILTSTNQFIHICKGTDRIDQKKLNIIHEAFDKFEMRNRGTRSDPKYRFDRQIWYRDIFRPLADAVRESQITAKKKYADPPGEDII